MATCFQGWFKAVLVQNDTHFLEGCRYVVLNPVRAKTVRHPRHWKWSSYGTAAGLVESHGCLTVDEILSHFGQRKPNPSKIRRASEFGETIFTESQGKASRDRLIAEAMTAHGYSQMELASFLNLHYSTISRIPTAR